MNETERNEKLARLKRDLHNGGFKCMWRAFIPMMVLFVFHKDGAGVFGILTENAFWFLQKYFTVAFIIGGIGYLLSLTVKIGGEK